MLIVILPSGIRVLAFDSPFSIFSPIFLPYISYKWLVLLFMKYEVYHLCLVIFLLMVHSPAFLGENSPVKEATGVYKERSH